MAGLAEMHKAMTLSLDPPYALADTHYHFGTVKVLKGCYHLGLQIANSQFYLQNS